MRTLYFHPEVSSSIFFLFTPNLSRRRLDVYHTFTHGAALVRIYDAGLKRTARDSLKIQDAKNRQKFATAHHPTILSACKGTHEQSEKTVKQQYIPIWPYNTVNFVPLAAEIGSLVWGTPAHFSVTARHSTH